VTAAFVLLVTGVGSLVPSVSRLRRGLPRGTAWAVWAVLATVLGVLGLALPVPVVLAVAAASALWWWASCAAPPGAHTRVVASDAALAIAVAALVLVVPEPTRPAPLEALLIPAGSAAPLGLPVLVAAPGVLALIGPAANRTVAAALAAVRARAGTLRTGDQPARPVSLLRGGRVIGPLERILIVGLALAGAEGALAALLAAKGIVRFPEISRDNAGNAAEEFLIGSLTSWLVAGLAALALHVLQNL